MLNTGKFKQFLSIPEAACVWEKIPFELLANAAYPSPGVPVLPGYPDLTARAEALIEATTFGTLPVTGRHDPDIPLPPPEQRLVSRQALLQWIAAHWPEAENAAPHAATAAAKPPAERLLTGAEVAEMLGVSKATLTRKRAAGEVPPPTHTGPNRWPLSVIAALVQRPSSAVNPAKNAAEDI